MKTPLAVVLKAPLKPFISGLPTACRRTLHLRLHVGSREELIRFLHVRVEVYAAVALTP